MAKFRKHKSSNFHPATLLQIEMNELQKLNDIAAENVSSMDIRTDSGFLFINTNGILTVAELTAFLISKIKSQL